MATFIQRCIYDTSSDYETDGGAIDHTLLERLLVLWNEEIYTAETLHALLGCSPSQETEMNEILALQPNQPAARAGWTNLIMAHIFAGSQGMPGHVGPSAVRVSMGLSP